MPGEVKASESASAAPTSKKAVIVNVLDGKRQQNTGIVLGRLRLDRNVVHDAVLADRPTL